MVNSINQYIVSKKDYIIFSVIAILYFITRFTVLPSGDSVMNINQIENYDIYSRSTHFTFHLLGVGFYAFFHYLFGLSGVISTEIMLGTVSLIGSIAFYRILMKIFPDENIPLVAVVIYALSSGIWRFSVQSEYVVIVPSIGLISFYFFQNKKYLFSGLFLGLGFLSSPFIMLMSPFYLYFLKKNEKNVWKIALLIIGLIIVYITVNLFTFKETVEGNWSYSMIIPYYFKFIRPSRAVMMLVYGYFRSFHILLPFVVIGLYYIFKKDKKIFWITIFIFIFHLPVIVNEARQGAYQFGVYPFFAIAAGIGLTKLFGKRRFIFNAIIVLYAFLNLLMVFSEKVYFNNLTGTYEKLNNNKDIPNNSILITYHHVGLLNYYAPRFANTGLLDDFTDNKMKTLFSEWEGSRIDTLMESKRDKYLLETGIREPDDGLKVMFPSIFSTQGALVKGYGKLSLAKYMKDKKFVLLKDYKIEVYKIEAN